MKTYKIVKLKSGEDLIAAVKVGPNATLKLHRPMIFNILTLQDGFGAFKEVIVLKSWIPLSKDPIISIAKDSVSAVANASEIACTHYESEKTREDEEVKMVNDFKAKKGNKPSAKKQPPLKSDNMLDFLQRQLENLVNETEDKLPTKEDSSLKDSIRPKAGEKMVYMNMIFSPEVIVELLRSGIIERSEFGNMIDEITNENGEGMNPSKFNGKKNKGNTWIDWNPDPSSDDYK